MIELQIDQAISDALIRLGVTKFQGGALAPYRAGAIVKIRPGSTIESHTRHAPGTLSHMGAFSYAADNDVNIINLMAGRYCSIDIALRIIDGNRPLGAVTSSPYSYGPFYAADNIPQDHVYRARREPFNYTYGPIKLGHDVWIGSYCMIKSGVTIGSGAVVTGGSNVVKDVPPYAVVGGNPAEVIRYRFAEDLRARLLAIQWWNVSPRILRDLNMYDPAGFCDRLERMQANGTLVPFVPGQLRIDEKGELWLTETETD